MYDNCQMGFWCIVMFVCILSHHLVSACSLHLYSLVNGPKPISFGFQLAYCGLQFRQYVFGLLFFPNDPHEHDLCLVGPEALQNGFSCLGQFAVHIESMICSEIVSAFPLLQLSKQMRAASMNLKICFGAMLHAFLIRTMQPRPSPSQNLQKYHYFL